MQVERCLPQFCTPNIAWQCAHRDELELRSQVFANCAVPWSQLRSQDAWWIRRCSRCVSEADSSHIDSHSCFSRSANNVLDAVRATMNQYKATKVTLLGHSLGQYRSYWEEVNLTQLRLLGGAIATIATVHLKLNLPAGTTFRTITYGSPRVSRLSLCQDIICSLLSLAGWKPGLCRSL